MLRELIYIAFGGAAGALARYGVGLLAGRWLGTAFPYGILAVNVVGCLVIGVLAAVVERRETLLSEFPNLVATVQKDALISFVRYGLMIGFLGGLTTFSSFGLDTLKLAESHRFDLALGNIALNVLLGLAAAWAGLWLVRAL